MKSVTHGFMGTVLILHLIMSQKNFIVLTVHKNCISYMNYNAPFFNKFTVTLSYSRCLHSQLLESEALYVGKVIGLVGQRTLKISPRCGGKSVLNWYYPHQLPHPPQVGGEGHTIDRRIRASSNNGPDALWIW